MISVPAHKNPPGGGTLTYQSSEMSYYIDSKVAEGSYSPIIFLQRLAFPNMEPNYPGMPNGPHNDQHDQDVAKKSTDPNDPKKLNPKKQVRQLTCASLCTVSPSNNYYQPDYDPLKNKPPTGTPTPPAMTGKAAKPLPITMVNSAMPIQYTATATSFESRPI